MEERFPGMWQRWYKHQCVAVGWAGKWGFHLNGRRKRTHGWGGWTRARQLIKAIQPGDYILVSLRGNRIGRLGQVTGKAIDDTDWDPLVPRSKKQPDGEMGRRIFVRWDLTAGPDDRELIVVLPPCSRLSLGELRPTVAEIRSRSLKDLRRAMSDSSNWSGLLQFSYERSMSEYISAYPHRLEDGLLPHPDKKVRERIFKDRKRTDVLLQDRNGVPVIVECKQYQPDKNNIIQLRHYMKRFRREEGQRVRGILVHGGARKLRREVRVIARKKPAVELVQYHVEVNFSASQ